MRNTLILSSLAFSLMGCAGLPSPQDTQPTEQSKCAAIRTKIAQPGPDNNTPAAISDSQNINYQALYQKECE